MYRPLHLFVACCCSLVCSAQTTDTLKIFYRADGFSLSKEDKQKLDEFLRRGWDNLSIKSYTDETDGEEYNMALSGRRAEAVRDYVTGKNVAAAAVTVQCFGESMPVADNGTDEGRALNRQTTVVGYRFPRLQPKPHRDPAKSVTTTLDNGFIVTYRPGSLPASVTENFDAGSGANFSLLTNTVQMRQYGLYNNTTRGEVLSSVLIVCGERFNPCKLDTPVLVQIPLPFKTACPVEKVKFFNAVAEKGKMVWQEQSKDLLPEVINGRQYIRLWLDDFCQCINFDFKVDPDCFDMDSARLLVNRNIKNLTAEMKELNSVYLPRKTADSAHSILFLKGKPADASISFALYNGKRRIKGFYHRPLSAFPYNERANAYVLSTDTVRFSFPDIKEYNIALKVTGDRYRTFLEKHTCEFVYLNRGAEVITVDLWVAGKRGRITEYKNVPLASFPNDAVTGCRTVDKQFLRTLEKQNVVTLK